MSAPALEVRELRVELAGGETIVDSLDVTVARGEILGLVGESGSGKTTAGLAVLGYAKPGGRIAAGRVTVAGKSILEADAAALRRLRGRLVAYVPQDPAATLDPLVRIESHLRETIRTHFPDLDPRSTIPQALARVGLPGDRAFRRRFPHQLSGGQQQRVAIAAAVIGDPAVVVLDEPTTGLDVVTQARILNEIRRLRDSTGSAMVYVSHNLAVVAAIADRIAVMYAGEIVEEGGADQIVRRPRHPYTRGLVLAAPDHVAPRRLMGIPGVAVGVGERPLGCAFFSRCSQRLDRCMAAHPKLEAAVADTSVRCFAWRETPPLVAGTPMVSAQSCSDAPLLKVEALVAEHRGHGGRDRVVDAVDLALGRSDTLALVGESGSGKTTIARCIAGLHEPASGRIYLDGALLAPLAKGRPRVARRRVQIVFQNPTDSLNPRRRIRDQIARPAQLLRGKGAAEAAREADELLERVRLPARLGERWPPELSGGERQRVAIARALAAGPDILICDEITSALDVSVQAAVLDVLGELRTELGLALLYISHDLGVVASIADQVVVLESGVIRERGSARALIADSQDDYTRELVDTAPRLPAIEETAEPVG